MELFSQKELQYLSNTDFLLTKRIITDKVKELLGQVEQSLKEKIGEYHFPDKVLQHSGKISKGENYQGLPYLILDYPRKFNNQEIFAFRIMFWWGHFFSATLHLGGKHWKDQREGLIKRRHLLAGKDWYICVNQSPWEYHYQSDNYKIWDNLKKEDQLDLLQTHPFLKLSKKWDLANHSQFTAGAIEAFAQAMEMMNRPN